MLFISTEEKSLTIEVSQDSSLKIRGESNINKFQCSYDITQISDTIRIKYTSEKTRLFFSNAQLKLTNTSFNCGHKAINRDFQKLLKTEDFPDIKLQLISAEGQPNSSILKAKLNIIICGVSKIHELSVEVENTIRGVMICGTLPIDINDYNLDPPKKLLGMIKVSKLINIEFNLAVKTLQ
jgi:hypothetical protein